MRLGKRFAHLTSTVADKSIEETLGHEMYVKLPGRLARRSELHREVPPLPPCFAKVTITLQTTFTSTPGNHSLWSSVRPGYTQTNVTHPVLGWGGVNVGLHHLGAYLTIQRCPTHVFCGILYIFAIIIIVMPTFANLRISE